MEETTGERNDVYEQVLEHARREIETSASQVDELRRTLGLLEARVEAAKAVYEAAAARLNLQDESEAQGLSVSEALSSVQALLPAEESANPRPRARNRQDAGSGEPGKQSGETGETGKPWRRLQIGGSTVVWKRIRKQKRRQRHSGGSSS